jgi:hypothetical protein
MYFRPVQVEFNWQFGTVYLKMSETGDNVPTVKSSQSHEPSKITLGGCNTHAKSIAHCSILANASTPSPHQTQQPSSRFQQIGQR